MVTWSGERADRLPVGRYLTPVSDMSERAPEATVPAARCGGAATARGSLLSETWSTGHASRLLELPAAESQQYKWRRVL